MQQAERQMPMSIEGEQALLGAALYNGEAFERAAKYVSASDFSQPAHQRLWKAIGGLVAEGRKATITNLKATLGDIELAEGVTFGAYIGKLAANATTIINADDFAKTVRDLADRRRIIDYCGAVVDEAHQAPVEARPSAIAAGAIDALDGIVARGTMAAPRVTIGRAVEDTIDRVYAQMRGEVKPALRTGIRGIDRRLNGLEPGDLIVMAGRPGAGKSAVAVQIALNIAERRDPDNVAREGVAFISLEMMAGQIAQRAISNVCWSVGKTKVEYKEIRKATDLKDHQLEAMENARRHLRDLPLVIEQEGSLTLAQIGARLRRIKGGMEAQGKELKLGIVDYLQIIKAPKGMSNREREVAEISAGLKAMAKDIGIPILALAQLSRQVEARKLEDRRPQLSDLRESGAIEQDADCVLSLFREAYYLQEDRSLSDAQKARIYEVENEIEVAALKVRQGATGVAKLYCNIGSNVFSDPAVPEGGGLSL